jgi:hypothetical protein
MLSDRLRTDAQPRAKNGRLPTARLPPSHRQILLDSLVPESQPGVQRKI